MCFDWTNTEPVEQENEKIPEGEGVAVTIDRVITKAKGKAAFTSKSGDPQIMVIFVDTKNREAAQMITLGERSAWVLARLMSKFGADMEELKSNGIEPKHFTSKDIYDRYLVGLTGLVNITWEENGGKSYAKIEPCDMVTPAEDKKVLQRRPPKPKPQDNTDGYTTISEDDIPF